MPYRHLDDPQYMRPKNWRKFQHYQDNRPLTWIKNYVDLDEHPKFCALSYSDQGKLQKLWRLAARLGNDGLIPYDQTYIRKHLHDNRFALASQLLSDWFAIGTQTELKTAAQKEKSLEQTEKPSSPRSKEVRSKRKPLPIATATAEKKSRKRDEVWDTVIEVVGVDQQTLTRSERGRINKAVKELREVGATPPQIRVKASAFRKRYQGATLTATALSTNWASLEGTPGGLSPEERRARRYAHLHQGAS